MHQAEPFADDTGTSKQRTDFFRCRVGRNVEVLGLHTGDKIAHRAAHDIGLIALVLQDFAHLDRVARNEPPVDSMLCGRNTKRFPWAENTVDEFFKHYSLWVGCKMAVRPLSSACWVKRSRTFQPWLSACALRAGAALV